MCNSINSLLSQLYINRIHIDPHINKLEDATRLWRRILLQVHIIIVRVSPYARVWSPKTGVRQKEVLH